MTKYTKPLAARETASLPDSEIDYSDIPELDEQFWQNAELVLPPTKERITLRLDREVLDYFRRSGSGYQTRINAVLRAYVQMQEGKNAPR
ncbi:MAG: BrnA antitoxin family protein [Caldilineaceae bacterium]